MTIRKTWKPPLTAKSTCQSKCGPIVASTSAVQLMTLCGGCCKLHWKSFCSCRTHRAAQKSTLARTLAGQSEPQTTACSWDASPSRGIRNVQSFFCVVKSHSKKGGKNESLKIKTEEQRIKTDTIHFARNFIEARKVRPQVKNDHDSSGNPARSRTPVLRENSTPWNVDSWVVSRKRTYAN